MDNQITFDPSIYPKVYTIHPAHKLVISALLSGFIYLCSLDFVHWYRSDIDHGILWLLYGILFFLIVLLFNKIFAKYTLYADKITYISWLSKKEIRRDDVARIKRAYWRGPNCSKLVNKDKAKPSFSICDELLNKDNAWEAWMAISETKDS